MTHNYNASFVFFSLTRPFNCSKELAKILLVTYSGTYAMTISLIAVQFIYRYWAIFHQKRIKFFKGGKIFLWILFSAYFMFDWAASVYFLGVENDNSNAYIFLEFLENYNVDVRTLTHFAAIIYDLDWNINWMGVSTMASVSKNVIIQYVIIIYCGLIMHLKMGEKMKKFSMTNQRVHRQLFKTLVVQITLPTFLIFLPVMSMFILPFFNLKISFPTGFLLCSLSIYPAIDGIAVMYIITDYRYAIQSYIHKSLRFLTFNRIAIYVPENQSVNETSQIKKRTSHASNVLG
ncbi:unnamed protein product [Caenorhabditis angaria]|uniref:Seven TM Receptor n=1 Tax=Caenorhabditis angaria TaxID=860376 RepID=A0A9P1IUG1_9PELO|nr:unnamed protein product [Caenorhabditis angaria]